MLYLSSNVFYQWRIYGRRLLHHVCRLIWPFWPVSIFSVAPRYSTTREKGHSERITHTHIQDILSNTPPRPPFPTPSTRPRRNFRGNPIIQTQCWEPVGRGRGRGRGGFLLFVRYQGHGGVSDVLPRSGCSILCRVLVDRNTA